MKIKEIGDIRVWHIPQVPMAPFYVDVSSVHEAKMVVNLLADYDLFQYENHVKPDYANASGIEVWDGEDWEDLDEDDEYNG